jgi:hypothetical protein
MFTEAMLRKIISVLKKTVCVQNNFENVVKIVMYRYATLVGNCGRPAAASADADKYNNTN